MNGVTLRSVGDIETFEGISVREKQVNTEGKYHRRHVILPKECKVLARVVSVSCRSLVRATLLKIVDREIRRVGDGPQARYEGGINLPDGIPVHTVEEGMVLDLLDVHSPISAGDEPVGGGFSIDIVMRSGGRA